MSHHLAGSVVVLLHRPHDSLRTLERQAELIGAELRPVWPALSQGVVADFVLFDADMAHDEQFPWTPGEAPIPTIALIGSEAPGRIDWITRHRADAELMKPVGDRGLFSALLIARHRFAARRAAAALNGHRETVVRAALVLAAIEGSAEAGYARLRREAMARRCSIEAAAALIMGQETDGQRKAR